MLIMLTIIVAVYNIKEEFLKKCLDSLLDQGRTDYKVLVIDDGSTDNSGKICDQYAEKSDIITVIHQTNQGVSCARNNGIERAVTEWISFVDGDDWVSSDYVSEIYECLNGETAYSDMVMFNYSREFFKAVSEEYFDHRSRFLDEKDMDICRKGIYFKHTRNGKFNPYTVIAVWNKVYRTDFIKENNIHFIPKAKKAQDVLFNSDTFCCANKVYYLHKGLYHYRCWENSRTHRFDPKIIEYSEIEINYLMNNISRYDLDNDMYKYLYCRICKRIYSCLRLYYFHSKNKDNLFKKISDVKKFVSKPLYRRAIENADMELFDSQEKVFVYSLKFRLYVLCYLMVSIKNKLVIGKLEKN